MKEINVILPPIPDSFVTETLREQVKQWATAYHEQKHYCGELRLRIRDLQYENEMLRAQLAGQEEG